MPITWECKLFLILLFDGYRKTYSLDHRVSKVSVKGQTVHINNHIPMTEAVVLSLAEKTHPTQHGNRESNLPKFAIVHGNPVFPRARQVKLKEEMMETHTLASFYLFKQWTTHCHFPQDAIWFFIFYLGRSGGTVSGASIGAFCQLPNMSILIIHLTGKMTIKWGFGPTVRQTWASPPSHPTFPYCNGEGA